MPIGVFITSSAPRLQEHRATHIRLKCVNDRKTIVKSSFTKAKQTNKENVVFEHIPRDYFFQLLSVEGLRVKCDIELGKT